MTDRKYVIVCNEHSAIFNGALLFWGHKTNDSENRSFGGYTSDYMKCERYSLKEIEEQHYHFPVYQAGMSFGDFKKEDDIIISIEDLKNIPELKVMTVIYRP